MNLKTTIQSGLILAICVLLSTTGCKSTKKVTKSTVDSESVEKAASTALVKNQLRKLLTDSNLSVEELENQLNDLKAKNSTDPEVLELIKQVEAKLAQKKSELKAKTDKARSLATTQTTVVGSLSSIAKAPSVDAANDLIENTLDQFESPNTPVLIIIAEENGEKDYDKPTTIAKYLEYVKMQKRSEHKVDEVIRNTDGKITRLVFRK